MIGRSETRDEPSSITSPAPPVAQRGPHVAREPRVQSLGAAITGSARLQGKAALITGGDRGIGRAVALAFAREGADIAIAYLEDVQDAEDTCRAVEELGRRCVTIKGDIGRPAHCRAVVDRTVEAFGRLDILVNNAAERRAEEHPLDIGREHVERVFRTNVFAMFYLVQAALDHLRAQPGACIINTASVTAYRGSPRFLTYSASKGPSSRSRARSRRRSSNTASA